MPKIKSQNRCKYFAAVSAQCFLKGILLYFASNTAIFSINWQIYLSGCERLYTNTLTYSPMYIAKHNSFLQILPNITTTYIKTYSGLLFTKLTFSCYLKQTQIQLQISNQCIIMVLYWQSFPYDLRVATCYNNIRWLNLLICNKLDVYV